MVILCRILLPIIHPAFGLCGRHEKERDLWHALILRTAMMSFCRKRKDKNIPRFNSLIVRRILPTAFNLKLKQNRIWSSENKHRIGKSAEAR